MRLPTLRSKSKVRLLAGPSLRIFLVAWRALQDNLASGIPGSLCSAMTPMLVDSQASKFVPRFCSHVPPLLCCYPYVSGPRPHQDSPYRSHFHDLRSQALLHSKPSSVGVRCRSPQHLPAIQTHRPACLRHNQSSTTPAAARVFSSFSESAWSKTSFRVSFIDSSRVTGGKWVRVSKVYDLSSISSLHLR